ncbi:MAG: hypothetical protein GEU75_16360 [Dehalococcoidia bacterium]|nr:hypothetical protein [Dehalococcoidia bacterium]
MDIYCPVCGEPWDHNELHDVEGVRFEEARRRFASEGCRVFGSTHNSTVDTDKATKSALLHELLGDDIDGIAALMEDLG